MSAAFDYSRSVATAQRLIKRYGQAAVLRRATRGGTDYDPVVTTTDEPVTVAEMKFSRMMIDGSRIRATDKGFYLSTEGVSAEPTESDMLVIGGVAHQIVNIAPLSPGGVVIFYEIVARA